MAKRRRERGKERHAEIRNKGLEMVTTEGGRERPG